MSDTVFVIPLSQLCAEDRLIFSALRLFFPTLLLPVTVNIYFIRHAIHLLKHMNKFY